MRVRVLRASCGIVGTIAGTPFLLDCQDTAAVVVPPAFHSSPLHAVSTHCQPQWVFLHDPSSSAPALPLPPSPAPQVARYALRWLLAWLCLEALTHGLYYNAIAKHRVLDYLTAAGLMRLRPVHYAYTGYWVLIFMWLKVRAGWGARVGCACGDGRGGACMLVGAMRARDTHMHTTSSCGLLMSGAGCCMSGALLHIGGAAESGKQQRAGPPGTRRACKHQGPSSLPSNLCPPPPSGSPPAHPPIPTRPPPPTPLCLIPSCSSSSWSSGASSGSLRWRTGWWRRRT